MVVGTVPYMSPEQVRGEEVDARTDLFSLGVLLYEVLSGRQPFAAESVADTMSAILTHEPPPLARYSREANAELERIVAKALRKDREERYQTARDLLLDLRSLADEMRFEARLERSVPPDVKGGPRDEVSSARTVIIETAARGPARTTAGAEPSTRDQKKASNIGGRSRASAVRTALVVVAALAVVAAAGWYYRRSSNARWAAGQVPRVEQLAQAGNYFAAYDLAVTVQKHLPNDPTVTRLMPTISDTLSVTTEPPGALVYLKRFSADESGQFPPRELVGATPVKDLRIARGQYVIQI
jgi:eukaryotic-like serine/threonine-protein kinase